MSMRATNRAICALVVLLGVSGCAGLRSYDQQMQATLMSASGGNVDQAIKMYDEANSGTKDLLYYLEIGMLQRLGQRYDESQKSWQAAVERVQVKEAGDDEAVDVLKNASSY